MLIDFLFLSTLYAVLNINVIKTALTIFSLFIMLICSCIFIYHLLP